MATRCVCRVATTPQRGGRAQVADLVFVAADYPAGKTAAVTRTRADRLVLESGDPTAYESGSLSRLRELGKPSYVASLLVRRRDGDPRGEIAQPRSQLVWAEAVSDEELRFELRETLFTASSQTSAVPTSRSVQARAIFVPPDEGAGTAGFLLTAWASSPSSEAQALCEPVPCLLEGASLGFECPAPRCKTPGTAPPPRDATGRRRRREPHSDRRGERESAAVAPGQAAARVVSPLLVSSPGSCFRNYLMYLKKDSAQSVCTHVVAGVRGSAAAGRLAARRVGSRSRSGPARGPPEGGHRAPRRSAETGLRRSESLRAPTSRLSTVK